MNTNGSAPIIPFGKYKGQPVEQLQHDPGYVDWLMGQTWFSEKFSNIHTIIVNNFKESSDTPEHNRLQAMAWDDKFAIAAYSAREVVRGKKPVDFSKYIKWREENSVYREKHSIDKQIEYKGWDIFYTPTVFSFASPHCDGHEFYVADCGDCAIQRYYPCLKCHCRSVVGCDNCIDKRVACDPNTHDRWDSRDHVWYGYCSRCVPHCGTHGTFDSNCIECIAERYDICEFHEEGAAEMHCDKCDDGKTVRKIDFYSLAIELKPTIGDDYPAILREVKARIARCSESQSWLSCVIAEQFSSKHVSLDMVKQMFFTSGVPLIMLDDMEIKELPDFFTEEHL